MRKIAPAVKPLLNFFADAVGKFFIARHWLFLDYLLDLTVIPKHNG